MGELLSRGTARWLTNSLSDPEPSIRQVLPGYPPGEDTVPAGDNTAYLAGRVTFNPFKHIDLFGTILLPGLLLFGSGGTMAFGYAKPVPVNFANLYRWRRDSILVALAGPGSNLFLAVMSVLLFHVVFWLPESIRTWVAITLEKSILINLLLFFFNLIPMPPLDGGRVLVGILPDRLAWRVARLERAGFAIILAALFVLPWLGNQLGMNLNLFAYIVGIPTFATAGFLFDLVGLK